MSETKWTPGPWRAIPDNGTRIPDKILRVVGPSEIVCGEDGICSHDHYSDRYFDESSANMHLIAAAPELYECLEFLCAWLKGQGFGDTSDKALPGEYDYAIEVLAKARGEV